MSCRADRRAFLRTAGGGVVALALGACAGVVAPRVPVRSGRIVLSLAEHPALAPADGTLTVQPEGWPSPLVLLRTDDGGVVALSPVCTHQGCVVEVAGRRLVCPCHGSTYERTGEVVRGPAERALTRFRARIEGDRVAVDVAEPETNETEARRG